MDLFMHNYQWIFSGIGVLIVGSILTYFLRKNKPEGESTQSNNNNNSNTVNVNNIIGPTIADRMKDKSENEEKMKSQTRILFIDDNHTDFKMVSILKRAGWGNTKSVKDITDLDDPKVLESEIVFVDINGVGTTMFQDQGLGLASALKKKYCQKKIVLYSAETTGDRFHRALREVDDCLSKNAEPYQFINLIESFSKHN